MRAAFTFSVALAALLGADFAHAQPAAEPAPPTGGQPAPAPAPSAVPDVSYDVAVLGGLDKNTARVVSLEAPVGQPVRFGTLEIIARACKKRRPEDQPESAAFLDVWELKPHEPAAGLFRGWMFASSPALSAMEHPVYDIWVLDCRSPSSQVTPSSR
jgi:hypothetical protein